MEKKYGMIKKIILILCIAVISLIPNIINKYKECVVYENYVKMG